MPWVCFQFTVNSARWWGPVSSQGDISDRRQPPGLNWQSHYSDLTFYIILWTAFLSNANTVARQKSQNKLRTRPWLLILCVIKSEDTSQSATLLSRQKKKSISIKYIYIFYQHSVYFSVSNFWIKTRPSAWTQADWRRLLCTCVMITCSFWVPQTQFLTSAEEMERWRRKGSFPHSQSLKVKGHGLWTWNVTVSRQRFDPSVAPSVCIYWEGQWGTPLFFQSTIWAC